MTPTAVLSIFVMARGLLACLTLRRVARLVSARSNHRTGMESRYIPPAMILPLVLAFQLAAGRPAVFHALKGQTEARAPRIDTTITIDGPLDTPVWPRAAILRSEE